MTSKHQVLSRLLRAAALLPEQGRRHLRGPSRSRPGILRPARRAERHQTDYNNDGRLDMFIHRGGLGECRCATPLLRNNGDGTFTDVTKRGRAVSSRTASTHSAAWADYDNDGCARPVRRPRVVAEPALSEPGRRHLRGRDRAGRRRCDAPFTKGVVAGRLRQRRLARPLRLEHLRRTTSSTTTTATARSPTSPRSSACRSRFVSFPTWFFDYDNDGWLDIFVVSYPPSLSRSSSALPEDPGQRPRPSTLYPQQRRRHLHDVTRGESG